MKQQQKQQQKQQHPASRSTNTGGGGAGNAGGASGRAAVTRGAGPGVATGSGLAGAQRRGAAVVVTATTAPLSGGATASRHQLPIVYTTKEQLRDIRVVQRNLVYAIGLPPSTMGREAVLRRPEFFGQYGRLVRVVVNRAALPQTDGRCLASAAAYITYAREADARAAILATDGLVVDGRVLRAYFGTTKYCHAWLRSEPCTAPDCLYLHEFGDSELSFTEREMRTSSGGNSFGRIFAEQVHAEAPEIAALLPAAGTPATGGLASAAGLPAPPSQALTALLTGVVPLTAERRAAVAKSRATGADLTAATATIAHAVRPAAAVAVPGGVQPYQQHGVADGGGTGGGTWAVPSAARPAGTSTSTSVSVAAVARPAGLAPVGSTPAPRGSALQHAMGASSTGVPAAQPIAAHAPAAMGPAASQWAGSTPGGSWLQPPFSASPGDVPAASTSAAAAPIWLPSDSAAASMAAAAVRNASERPAMAAGGRVTSTPLSASTSNPSLWPALPSALYGSKEDSQISDPVNVEAGRSAPATSTLPAKPVEATVAAAAQVVGPGQTRLRHAVVTAAQTAAAPVPANPAAVKPHALTVLKAADVAAARAAAAAAALVVGAEAMTGSPVAASLPAAATPVGVAAAAAKRKGRGRRRAGGKKSAAATATGTDDDSDGAEVEGVEVHGSELAAAAPSRSEVSFPALNSRGGVDGAGSENLLVTGRQTSDDQSSADTLLQARLSSPEALLHNLNYAVGGDASGWPGSVAGGFLSAASLPFVMSALSRVTVHENGSVATRNRDIGSDELSRPHEASLGALLGWDAAPPSTFGSAQLREGSAGLEGDAIHTLPQHLGVGRRGHALSTHGAAAATNAAAARLRALLPPRNGDRAASTFDGFGFGGHAGEGTRGIGAEQWAPSAHTTAGSLDGSFARHWLHGAIPSSAEVSDGSDVRASSTTAAGPVEVLSVSVLEERLRQLVALEESVLNKLHTATSTGAPVAAVRLVRPAMHSAQAANDESRTQQAPAPAAAASAPAAAPIVTPAGRTEGRRHRHRRG